MVSVALFACNPIKLNTVPSASATIYGNGGSAVVKGDYIYFANAYVDYNNLGINDNRYDEKSQQVIYGIYRVSVNEYGKVELDENDKPKNVEIVTYNIGGYAYSGLYICGDYLYYSTPYTTAEEDGSVTHGRVRFERVKLDGTNREIVYSCANYDEDSDYDIVYIDGTTYITIKDGSNALIVVKCRGNNIYKYTINSSVTSFAVYNQRDIVYGETLSDMYNYAYYTVKDSNDKYNMYRKKLDNLGSEELILNLQSDEIKLVSVQNERVYYTLDSKLFSVSYTHDNFVTKRYASISIEEGGSSSSTITSYQILEDRNMDLGIVAVYYDGSNYSLKLFNNSIKDLGISFSSSITLLGSQDGELYYQVSGDDSLYATSLSFNAVGVDVEVTAQEPREICPSFSMSGDNAKSKFDFDKDRIFVYSQVDGETNNKYLTMYMINNQYRDEDDNVIGHYVGVLSGEDYDLVHEDDE